jgi:hypothetical protein
MVRQSRKSLAVVTFIRLATARSDLASTIPPQEGLHRDRFPVDGHVTPATAVAVLRLRASGDTFQNGLSRSDDEASACVA